MKPNHKPNRLNFILATIPIGGLIAIAAVAQEASTTPTPTPAALPAVVASATPSPSPSPVSAGESEEKKIAADPAATADTLPNVAPSFAVPTPLSNLPAINDYPLDKKEPFGKQPPSPKNGVTLDQVVQTALQKNASILEQLAEIKRTRGVVVEVRAAALPDITSTATYNQSDPTFNGRSTTTSSSSSTTTGTAFLDGQTVPTTFTVLGSTVTGTAQIPGQTVPITLNSASASTTVRSAKIESWNLSFQLQQTIYAGGKIVAGIRQARILEDSAFFQLRDTVDLVIDDVRKQFYLVLLNRALIEVDKESVSLLQSQLTDQQNRFEAGTVPRFNVLQAEVALANAQPTLIKAKNDYRTAQLTLAKLVGISWPTTTDLDPFPVKGVLEYLPRKIDLNEAVETAKERRAFLKVQRQTILADLEAVKIALAGYQPTITGNIGWEFKNDTTSNYLNDNVNGWFFGFNGSWDIWDSFATAGRAQQARARLESAKVNYDDSVRQVELEVQTAYSNIIQSRETIESQQKTVEEAQESLRLSQERFAAGAGTQLEVLDAQVALSQAQTTALQALADYNSNLAEFDRVTGVSTVYHETFDDPMTNPKIRKHWYSVKQHTHGSVLTDEEIRDNLLKRRKESQQSQGD